MFSDAHDATSLTLGEGGASGFLSGVLPLNISPSKRARVKPLDFVVGGEPDAAPLPHNLHTLTQYVAGWQGQVPDPYVERVPLEDGRSILVVRDDLLPGGTKVRILLPMLRPGREYVYASPAQGYAQLALAVATRAVGAKATVFVAARKQDHRNTALTVAYGANVVRVKHGYLSVVTSRARAYCLATGARLLPFGLDTPKARTTLAKAARAIPAPAEAWCVAGSGMLCRSLMQAWPGTSMYAVRTGHLPDVGDATLYVAPERFEQRAQRPPLFPSCLEYDAKAWRFIEDFAQDGALFWNVGG